MGRRGRIHTYMYKGNIRTYTRIVCAKKRSVRTTVNVLNSYSVEP